MNKIPDQNELEPCRYCEYAPSLCDANIELCQIQWEEMMVGTIKVAHIEKIYSADKAESEGKE